MFNDNQITAYRNIKAPNDLHQRIIKRTKKSYKPLYFISAVAACFIFIISAGIISNNQENIVINGQKLTKSIVFYDTTSYGRNVSHSISVPVEIETARDTKISVSDGLISIDGSNPQKEISISSSTIIWWEIEISDSKNIFEMKISDKKGANLVTLKYDDAKITVSKEKLK